jgi:uncharacterized protein YciU (UPF0263 family)
MPHSATTRYILLLLLPLLLLNLECKKEPSFPTEEDIFNTERLSVFACKVDGEEWTASSSYNYDEFSGTLNLSARNFKGEKEEVIGFAAQFKSVGMNSFFQAGYNNRNNNCPPSLGYELDSLFFQELEIALLDKEERVIIGFFEFTAIDESCADTVHITEGRFKASY